MHVLFVHPNFPAQFGHVAARLVAENGYRATFVSEKPAGQVAGIERIRYAPGGGARRSNHYCSRTFENQIWHAHGVYEAMAARPDIRPDLVVAHSGLTSSLFLRELYDAPFIGYFELFYRARGADIGFRTDLPPHPPLDYLRLRARNALLLLDLENCDAGYSPTEWQRSQIPGEFQPKLETLFDGIDTAVWRPRAGLPRRCGGLDIPQDVRIVTYVSRGMESKRGFDIFMKLAKRICDRRRDVVFLVVGSDRVVYSGDERFTGGKSFKQWVLDQDDYDLERIRFLGMLPPTELAKLLALSDLHVYLTAPFVLSWSLLNAMACGATVLGSDTAPVRELIGHGRNGLLCDFFDVEAMEREVNRVLDDPRACRALGRAASELIRARYGVDACVPRLRRFYERVASGG